MLSISKILEFSPVQGMEATLIFYFNKHFSAKELNSIKKALDWDRHKPKVSFDLTDQEQYLKALEFINSFKDIPFSREYLIDAAKFRLYATIGLSDVFSMKKGRIILNRICRTYLNGDLHNLRQYRLGDCCSTTPAGNFEVSDTTATRILHAGFALVPQDIYNPILSAFFTDFEIDQETREKFFAAYLSGDFE